MTAFSDIRAEKAKRSPAERKAMGEAWLKENAAAIEAYNKRVRECGLLIKPIWE